MEEPSFWDHPEKAQKTILALKPLNGLIKPFEELSSSADDLNAMAELAAEEPSMESEWAAELDKAQERLDAFELQAMLSGPQDAANAFVRIQAGAGGTDACDWAEMLLRMYTKWAEGRGFSVELTDEARNEEAGIQNATVRIVGDYAYGYLQGETGVHRLVRISPFGSGDTRQTSFAAVEVVPELDDNIQIEVKEAELEVQTFCSGGPGGQHQNKTQSGVRIIHKSGVRAESRTERSQHKNYDNALKMLKSRLYAIEEQKRMGDIEKRYDSKGEIAFGSQIRSYVLQPYTLVREERPGIDLKTPAVQSVLEGEIEPFLHAYLRHKTERANKAGKAGRNGKA
jgi:peptide chain release factor 2